MKKIIYAIIVMGMLLPCQPVLAQALSKQVAIALAEKFIVENGYTNAAPDRIKRKLDFESIERAHNRGEMLSHRHNTLQPKAIGAKDGRKGAKAGWSVAFDYVPGIPGGRDICRVVTMDGDGSNMRVEHVDGTRKFFVGFD